MAFGIKTMLFKASIMYVVEKAADKTKEELTKGKNPFPIGPISKHFCMLMVFGIFLRELGLRFFVGGATRQCFIDLQECLDWARNNNNGYCN